MPISDEILQDAIAVQKYLQDRGEWISPSQERAADFAREILRQREVIAGLVAALEAVEWTWGLSRLLCQWCQGWRDDGGHKQDCRRQVALALAKGPNIKTTELGGIPKDSRGAE